MTEYVGKKKSPRSCHRQKQMSLHSFFSSKNTKGNAADQGNCSIILDNPDDTANNSSSSPEIIAVTPQSKPRPIRRLTNYLNLDNLKDSVDYKKKLFPDDSITVNDYSSREKSSQLENLENKNNFKRSNDDVFDELLEEIENSSPVGSNVSMKSSSEKVISKKRLKLCSSKTRKKNHGENSTLLEMKESVIINSQDLSKQKIRLCRTSGINDNENKCTYSKSSKAKMEDSPFNTTDLENLGDLFDEDFNSHINDELNLTSWSYCEITKIEKIQVGIKAQLKEATYSKCEPLFASCYIRGYWGESELGVGDIVSIKARFDHSLNGWLIDEKEGFLVKYPNLLVTGTSIVGSLFCLRKAVLSYLFPGLDPPNISMILGSLVHELFQEILKNKVYKKEDMAHIAADLLSRRRTLLDSYECNVSISSLKLELEKFVPKIDSFVKMYLTNENSRKMWAGRIEEIFSIEENFWVPQLGVKGKTDLIVKARVNTDLKTIPIELKTGRPTNSVEHRGQIILYLLMMTELNMKVDTGLLLYLKDNVMHEIIPRQGEMNGLVTIRNNLVDYFMKNETMTLGSNKLFSAPVLPEPINHHSACSKCPYLTVCAAALSKENDLKLSKNNPLVDLSVSAVKHLSSSHIEYVFHWLGLLKLEGIEKNNDRFVKVSDIWFKDPEERQKRGSCISQLIITDVTDANNFFSHHMKKLDDDYDFTLSGIVEGDYIVVSTGRRFAVATGFVEFISEKAIKLKLDRKLDKQNNESHAVDKYSRTEGLLGFNCSNLLLLLENSSGAATLRSFIIDLKLPSFMPTSTHLSEQCNSILAPLNLYQRESILKVLAANNFSLIKGLPGTGKTATIVALIKILVHLRYSVLLTSHTHSAVDNVLLRLKNSVDFLRLGSSSKVHPAIESFCEDVIVSDLSINSTEDVAKFYDMKPVVGVTCMGCTHVLLSKRKFDFCIIDEATQVLQPSIIKALYSSRKFILVGDPDQLPPVVHNQKASRLGLSESLFHRLDRPEVTTTLHFQYRMNSEIMKLANSFSYKSELKCCDENVNSATIKMKCPLAIITQNKWLNSVLSCNLLHSLIFLNTANLEVTDLNSVYCNELEAEVALLVIDALKKSFQETYEIGIIAPYRDQVQLLKRHFSKKYEDVEINTIDQFQGRDKDIIIFSSTMWSNKKEEGILGDKRRLTVAITRAKRKLIIIGNASILKDCSVFGSLLCCISAENVINIDHL